MKVGYSKRFLQQYAKLSPKIQGKVDERILLWQGNELHPLLRNHRLMGKLKGYRSIDVTGDIRVLYIQRDNEVIFDIVGTHSELYG